MKQPTVAPWPADWSDRIERARLVDAGVAALHDSMPRNAAAIAEVFAEDCQLRVDFAMAREALRLIAYSAFSNREAVQIADRYLRGWACRQLCSECGERADFITCSGVLACYNCANNAGDADV